MTPPGRRGTITITIASGPHAARRRVKVDRPHAPADVSASRSGAVHVAVHAAAARERLRPGAVDVHASACSSDRAMSLRAPGPQVRTRGTTS